MSWGQKEERVSKRREWSMESSVLSLCQMKAIWHLLDLPQAPPFLGRHSRHPERFFLSVDLTKSLSGFNPSAAATTFRIKSTLLILILSEAVSGGNTSLIIFCCSSARLSHTYFFTRVSLLSEMLFQIHPPPRMGNPQKQRLHLSLLCNSCA